jgi:23S rRNA G2069 N7-methylase RlmK/C1962 C5-methylase RlmI
MLRTRVITPAPVLFGLAVTGWGIAGFVTGLLLVRSTQVELTAQNSSQSISAQAPSAQAPPIARVFGSDAGMVLNFIKPDRTADFETIVTRLKEALQKSDKPARKQQAATWKVFRATEPGANGSVLYVFSIDPAVKGADYTVSTILAEAFPSEVKSLYRQYADAYASGQNFVNLTLVSALGQEPPE